MWDLGRCQLGWAEFAYRMDGFVRRVESRVGIVVGPFVVVVVRKLDSMMRRVVAVGLM